RAAPPGRRGTLARCQWLAGARVALRACGDRLAGEWDESRRARRGGPDVSPCAGRPTHLEPRPPGRRSRTYVVRGSLPLSWIPSGCAVVVPPRQGSPVGGSRRGYPMLRDCRAIVPRLLGCLAT